MKAPSYEDGLQEQMMSAAYKAAVDNLKGLLAKDSNRLVKTLGKVEMSQLVASIVSAYASKRAELAQWERDNPVEFAALCEREWNVFS